MNSICPIEGLREPFKKTIKGCLKSIMLSTSRLKIFEPVLTLARILGQTTWTDKSDKSGKTDRFRIIVSPANQKLIERLMPEC